MKRLSNIKILDCTLRDGGYVNDFDFKKENIKKIIKHLINSKIDVIELGFLKNCEYSIDKTFYNFIAEAEYHLNEFEPINNFSLMIRPDWYDISKLKAFNGKIKNLRFAFHYNDLNLALNQAEKARNLGYNIIFNPVNINSYKPKDLENILINLNKFNPNAVYIVDTFGSMLPSDLKNIFSVFNETLNEKISIGLHLHENLSLSLGLACVFIDLIGNRNGYIDSTLIGMGREPGNLCTELMLNYINSYENNRYNLIDIYEAIENPISIIKKTNNWGYSPAYAITGFKKIHRSYAEFLLEKKELTLLDINNILNEINSESDKSEFKKSFIETLYLKYKNKKK